MSRKAQKITYRIIAALFLVTAVYVTVKHLLTQNYQYVFMGPVSLLFLLIPSLAGKLFKKKLGFAMTVFVLLFSYFAFSLGVALRWYEQSAIYDKVLHLISGLLFTVIGFYIYAKLSEEKPYNIERKWKLQITFAFCFSMFVAVIWEIYEFMGFVLVGHDAQHHLTTGVFDTMQDIISCFIGSAVFAVFYLLYIKKGFVSPFVKLVQSFEDEEPGLDLGAYKGRLRGRVK